MAYCWPFSIVGSDFVTGTNLMVTWPLFGKAYFDDFSSDTGLFHY